jgi:hypothetical protein
MNKTITRLLSTIILLALICITPILHAQKNIKYSPEVTSNFSLSVQNLVQTAPNKLEFDVYLLNTLPAGTIFELAKIQLGFLINASIQGSGTLTLTLSNTDSGLKSYQQFSSTGTGVSTSLEIYPDKTLLKQSAQALPGSGNGTIISSTAPGTKLVHYILTNTVNFVSNTVPGLAFISTNNPDPYQELFLSSVSYYANGIVTNLSVSSGTNATVSGNPVLNPSATAFNVTGTGSICSGLGGLPVGLDGSQTGVTYTLYKNAVAQTPTVAGTGSTISFGNQPAGTYTVTGTLNSASTNMTGNAVITETPSVTSGVSISADNNPIITGAAVTFTATPTGGGTSPSYQWYNGTNQVGTNSSVYTYTPTNNDVISVVMTSNATCITGNPAATSNTVTMSVTITSIDQNKMLMDVYSSDKNIIVNCTQLAKQVLIYNTLGSLLEKYNNVTGLNTFNMDKSPNGYYLVKIITDNEVVTQKVLLK